MNLCIRFNFQFIHKIVAHGTWIEYTFQVIRFLLKLVGVHNHLYGHYSFNIYLKKSQKTADKMEIAKIQVIGSHLQEIRPGMKHLTSYDLHWAVIPEEIGQYFDIESNTFSFTYFRFLG